MELVKLLLALSLPLVLGATCISLLTRSGTAGRAAAVAGNGMLFGLILLPLLMRLLDGFGVGLRFHVIVFFAAGLIVVLVAANSLKRRGPAPVAIPEPALTAMHRLLIGLFLILLGLRLLSVGLELVWRPLFPWDATMHWATKARVWFDAGGLVPFVEESQWLRLGGEGVYTDHHPGYPVTIPLLQLWLSLALDRWDESLMNLPWLLCCAGLAIAFYGQARAAGSTALSALVFTYMLVSMPLIGSHVALAGYADLFLGACYCAALMAFHNWSLRRETGQALQALLFALCCPLIKNEGFFWALTFIPALVVVLLPLRWALYVLYGTFVAVVLALVLIPPDFTIAGHALDELRLFYRPGALAGVLASFWVQDNWHLLGYLLLPLLPISILSGSFGRGAYGGITTALLAAVLLFLSLFLFTRYSLGALRFTSVGRISLHLVPGLMFYCLLLWNGVSARAGLGRDPDTMPAVGAQ